MPSLKKLDTTPRLQPCDAAAANLRPAGGPVPLPDKDTAADGASADWRELARRIQQETDSGVMLDLVQELITKLDEQNSRKLARKQK
jgi:hypothetical protein